MKQVKQIEIKDGKGNVTIDVDAEMYEYVNNLELSMEQMGYSGRIPIAKYKLESLRYIRTGGLALANIIANSPFIIKHADGNGNNFCVDNLVIVEPADHTDKIAYHMAENNSGIKITIEQTEEEKAEFLSNIRKGFAMERTKLINKFLKAKKNLITKTLVITPKVDVEEIPTPKVNSDGAPLPRFSMSKVIENPKPVEEKFIISTFNSDYIKGLVKGRCLQVGGGKPFVDGSIVLKGVDFTGHEELKASLQEYKDIDTIILHTCQRGYSLSMAIVVLIEFARKQKGKCRLILDLNTSMTKRDFYFHTKDKISVDSVKDAVKKSLEYYMSDESCATRQSIQGCNIDMDNMFEYKKNIKDKFSWVTFPLDFSKASEIKGGK